jgi:hypothetical protein
MKIYLFYSTIVKSNKINFTPITHASSFHGDKMACGTTLFYIYKFLPSTYFAIHINTLKINNFPYLFTSLRTTILTKTDNFFTFSLRYTQQHWQKLIISLLHTATLMKTDNTEISASPTQLKNRNALKLNIIKRWAIT